MSYGTFDMEHGTCHIAHGTLDMDMANLTLNMHFFCHMAHEGGPAQSGLGGEKTCLYLFLIAGKVVVFGQILPY